ILVETARPIRPYRIDRRASPPVGNINRTHGFPGPHGPAPGAPHLAAREGFGPERPSPGAEGSSRPPGRRSRGRRRPTGNREEGMGRSDPAGTAPVGTMGEPGHLRTRSVPAQVRSNELAAARPFGPGPHEEDPPGREGDGPVPEPLLAVGRSRRPQQRSVHHRERGPHDGPIRVLEGPSDETGNRMARSPPEEGWRLALLPLPHRDARLLGGPRRLRGASLRGEDTAHPSIDRAGRGILPRATAVSGRTHSLSSVVPAPLSRPLLLRHPRRTRHPHVPRLWRGSAKTAPPRPPPSDTPTRRGLVYSCPSPPPPGTPSPPSAAGPSPPPPGPPGP